MAAASAGAQPVMSSIGEKRRGRVAVTAVAILALTSRILPYSVPGQILAVREYDDGVMLGGAIALLRGLWPYADFVYMHPPGSLLMLTGPAAVAELADEPVAMALARVVAVLIGVANTVLIGMLLRARGATAVVTGAGLYAVWPVIVATETTVLLEPVLLLGLFAALVLVRRSSGLAVVAAGVCLGLATTVKVWAIVDVVLVALMTWAMLGPRMLFRFAAGALAAMFAVCLPFFLRAPQAMWEQVVVAQLNRAGTPASLGARVGSASLARGTPGIDAVVPWWFWLLFLSALVALAVIPLGADVLARRPARLWSEASWWAVILLAHLAILLVIRGFFYHYAIWALGPLCLSLGFWVGGWRGRLWAWVGGACVAAIFLSGAFGAMSRGQSEPPSQRADVIAWAAQQTCIFAPSSTLIAVDAFRRNLDHDCKFDIDAFGAFLVEDPATAAVTDIAGESSRWTKRQWAHLQAADAAILPDPMTAHWFSNWLSDAQREKFVSRFADEGRFGSDALWERIDR